MAGKLKRAQVKKDGFNKKLALPYALKLDVFSIAMDDIYETFHNLNSGLVKRGLLPLENSVRGATYTALISDLMTESLASHAAGLVKNTHANGHPDLLPIGRYANDGEGRAEEGVEVKVTKKLSGAVDMHSASPAWYCVFTYIADYDTQPIVNREPTRFKNIWLAKLDATHFRKNERGERGTRTATPHKEGVKVLQSGLLYSDD